SAPPPSRRISLSFFTRPALTSPYTLSLHDALPISSGVSTPIESLAARATQTSYPDSSHRSCSSDSILSRGEGGSAASCATVSARDRKSTRLNSSHVSISYAVFCLQKKTNFNLIARI